MSSGGLVLAGRVSRGRRRSPCPSAGTRSGAGSRRPRQKAQAHVSASRIARAAAPSAARSRLLAGSLTACGAAGDFSRSPGRSGRVLAGAVVNDDVLLQPEPDGGYTVTCLSLPGLVTYGETLEQARAMAVEAVEVYLESLQIDDAPIPRSDVVDPGPLIEAVRVRFGRG